jgi:hypothetical protein
LSYAFWFCLSTPKSPPAQPRFFSPCPIRFDLFFGTNTNPFSAAAPSALQPGLKAL